MPSWCAHKRGGCDPRLVLWSCPLSRQSSAFSGIQIAGAAGAWNVRTCWRQFLLPSWSRQLAKLVAAGRQRLQEEDERRRRLRIGDSLRGKRLSYGQTAGGGISAMG